MNPNNKKFVKDQWYYAVGVGRQNGVYMSWVECKKHVDGIFNARYKKFRTRQEAEDFVEQHASPQKVGSSPYKPITPPRTPNKTTNNFYSQQPNPVVSPAMTKSREIATWANSQPVASMTAPLPEPATPPKQIKKERISPERNNSDILDAETQMFNLLEHQPNQEIDAKEELKALKRKLEAIEENINDIFGLKIQEINQLKTNIDKLECKINGTSQPELSQTIQRLREKRVQAEAKVPTKRARMIDMNEPQPSTSRQADNQINFMFDQEGYCIVYTDGACTNNGRDGAKAGIGIFFGNKHPLNVSAKLMDCVATNNNAEIQAASFAINVAKEAGLSKVCVNTDSEFVINCVTKWMTGWKRRGWRKADNKPVINKDQLLILDDAINGMDVKWVHVRGHSNIHGNEMADRLANEGALKYGMPSP